MGFVLGSIGMVLFLAGVLILIGHFNERADAEIVDWKPTRAPEVEAQNEIDDIRQMVDAQNEMRSRRGVPQLDEDKLRAEVEAEEMEKLRRGDPFDEG